MAALHACIADEKTVRAALVVAEADARFDLVVSLAAPLAATQVQRAFRAWRHRSSGLWPRVRATVRLRRVFRGYAARVGIGRLAASVASRTRSAGVSVTGSLAFDGSATASRVPVVRRTIIVGPLMAVAVLQRFMRNRIRRLAVVNRAQKIAIVVNAAVLIQRNWRMFVARRLYWPDIRKLRWQRQMGRLRSLLADVAVAPAARHVRTLIAQLGMGREKTSEESSAMMLPIEEGDEADDIFDPADDELFFKAAVKPAKLRVAATARANFLALPLERGGVARGAGGGRRGPRVGGERGAAACRAQGRRGAPRGAGGTGAAGRHARGHVGPRRDALGGGEAPHVGAARVQPVAAGP